MINFNNLPTVSDTATVLKWNIFKLTDDWQTVVIDTGTPIDLVYKKYDAVSNQFERCDTPKDGYSPEYKYVLITPEDDDGGTTLLSLTDYRNKVFHKELSDWENEHGIKVNQGNLLQVDLKIGLNSNGKPVLKTRNFKIAAR